MNNKELLKDFVQSMQCSMINSGELSIHDGVNDYLSSIEAPLPSGGKSAEEIEQWYHKWMADRGKSGIATVNVLDMLKDFAASQQPVNDGWVRVEKVNKTGFYVFHNDRVNSVLNICMRMLNIEQMSVLKDCLIERLPKPPKQTP